MVVPEFKYFYLPTLKFFGDNRVHTKKEVAENNKIVFELTGEDLLETTGNGNKLKYKDRTDWAVTHLHKANLLDKESRGNYIINDSGISLLADDLDLIDEKVLMRYESFAQFRNKTSCQDEEINGSYDIESLSPTERLDEAFSEINEELSSSLLEEIMKNSPDFFEELVVDLLIHIGYGGSRKEAGKRIGRSGDGGVDGVIKQDHLGLDNIYIQAKRYQKGNNISSETINSFIGALERKGSNKGVFITTSDFTRQAKEAIDDVNKQIALINGEKLTKLMIEFNVGVSTKEIYEIKEINSDYFDN